MPETDDKQSPTPIYDELAEKLGRPLPDNEK